MGKPRWRTRRFLALICSLITIGGTGCHENLDAGNVETLREFVGEFAHELAAAFLI